MCSAPRSGRIHTARGHARSCECAATVSERSPPWEHYIPVALENTSDIIEKARSLTTSRHDAERLHAERRRSTVADALAEGWSASLERLRRTPCIRAKGTDITAPCCTLADLADGRAATCCCTSRTRRSPPAWRAQSPSPQYRWRFQDLVAPQMLLMRAVFAHQPVQHASNLLFTVNTTAHQHQLQHVQSLVVEAAPTRPAGDAASSIDWTKVPADRAGAEVVAFAAGWITDLARCTRRAFTSRSSVHVFIGGRNTG